MFRELTRKKQALSPEACEEVLIHAPRGVLSVQGDDGYPYGMPMNFLYCPQRHRLYFHGGLKGHRVDALRRCDKVSFCVFDEGYRREGEWSLNIRSVIVFGRVRFLENDGETVEICRQLSLKYTSDEAYIENEIQRFLKGTLCFELIPEQITGKLVNES